MMKLIGKLLGGVATAAALAALIPYTSDYDAETDTQKTHALLWTLTSKPNLEGKRSYHFAFGKEDDPVIEFRAGESEAEAAAREAEAYAQQQRDAAREQADKIVAAARENAENDRKKIVDEANREAVSIAEAAMEKLLAKETSRAYDAFVNAAEGEEKHEHE